MAEAVDKATLAKARKTQSQLSGQIKAEDVKAKTLKGEADRRQESSLRQPQAYPVPGQGLSAVRARGHEQSTLLVRDACELATQGIHSILFEYEMDDGAVKRLIDDLGYDRERMSEFVHVVVPREPFSSALLMSHLGRWPDAKLIVLDNMSEAIASGDGSENESMDVLRTLGLLRGGRCVLRLLHRRFGCIVRSDEVSAGTFSARMRYRLEESLDAVRSISQCPGAGGPLPVGRPHPLQPRHPRCRGPLGRRPDCLELCGCSGRRRISGSERNDRVRGAAQT